MKRLETIWNDQFNSKMEIKEFNGQYQVSIDDESVGTWDNIKQLESELRENVEYKKDALRENIADCLRFGFGKKVLNTLDFKQSIVDTEWENVKNKLGDDR